MTDLPRSRPDDLTQHLPEDEIPTNMQHVHADPITGEPGSHPLGAALGAVSTGAAGAVLGSMAGPIGAIAGAVIGGLAGGIAGKELAENVNPTNPIAEDAYWCANYRQRPYVRPDEAYDAFRAAYQHGWEARQRHADKEFEEVEPELRERWEAHELKTSLEWERARDAARDAWQRVDERRRNEFDR